MTPDDLANHPVVAAALARHGLTPEDAIGSTEWRRHDRHPYWVGCVDGLPEVEVSQVEAIVRWGRTLDEGSRVLLRIRREADGWHHTVTVRLQGLPETVGAALVGRPLRDLVEIEGGEDLVITATAFLDRHVEAHVTPVPAG